MRCGGQRRERGDSLSWRATRRTDHSLNALPTQCAPGSYVVPAVAWPAQALFVTEAGMNSSQARLDLALQHLDLEAQGGVGEYPPGGEAVGAVSVLGGGCDHRHLTLLHRHHAEVPAPRQSAQTRLSRPLQSRYGAAAPQPTAAGAGRAVHHAGMTWPMPMVNTKASCPGSFVDQNFFCKSESAVGKS